MRPLKMKSIVYTMLCNFYKEHLRLLVGLFLCVGMFACSEEEIAVPNNALTPVIATIPEILTGEYEGLLVQIEGVEFNETDGTLFEGSRLLVDCNGNSVQVFTALNKAFSSEALPMGNGAIVAKVARSEGLVQLVLRSTNDVAAMTGLNCGVFANCEEKTGEYTNLCYLRNEFEENNVSLIGSNVKVRAQVTSRAQNGNIDANAVIVEDAGAGLLIQFDAAHNFEAGDILEIDISSQTLIDPEGWLQISNVPLSNAAKLGSNTLNPTIISINQLNSGIFESRLVKIENVSFTGADGNARFSDNLNHNFSDGSNQGIVRVNTTANFRGEIIPADDKNLIGNVGMFADGIQLIPGQATDVGLDGLPNEAQTCTDGTMLGVRDLYGGSPLNLNCVSGISITGIVSSDAGEFNISNQNIFIQDNSAGISVRFTAPHTFNLGDELTINLVGATLTEFQGLLQIENVAPTSANLISSNNTLTPKIITVSQLNAGGFEGQLVQINNVSFANAGQPLYDGTGSGTGRSFSDASGSAILFTNDDPAWAGSTILPAGSGNILVGNASEFDGEIRILIREPSDIQ